MTAEAFAKHFKKDLLKKREEGTVRSNGRMRLQGISGPRLSCEGLEMKRTTIISVLLIVPAFVLPGAAQSDETAKCSYLLPHIADGGGWQSTLLVTNVTDSASQWTLRLYGLSVDRSEHVGPVHQASGSTATFNLLGAGAYLAWPTSNQSPLASGYATLDCTEPVVAQVVFASIGSSDTPDGMAIVIRSQAGRVFQFLVLTPQATLRFAVANNTGGNGIAPSTVLTRTA